MPEGFACPVNHSYWIPWRLDSAVYTPRTGPAVSVFARSFEDDMNREQGMMRAIGITVTLAMAAV